MYKFMMSVVRRVFENPSLHQILEREVQRLFKTTHFSSSPNKDATRLVNIQQLHQLRNNQNIKLV